MIERRVQNFLNDPHNVRAYGIKLAYLFGSMADGRSGPRSDVDVGVLFTSRRGSYRIFQDSALLQIELGRLIPRPLDMVILNFASPLLKHEVIGGNNIYAESARTKINFEKQVEIEYSNFEAKLNSKFKRHSRVKTLIRKS